VANGNGRERTDKVPFSSVQTVSHSRWRHIGAHIASLVVFWARSAMGWAVPFSLGEPTSALDPKRSDGNVCFKAAYFWHLATL